MPNQSNTNKPVTSIFPQSDLPPLPPAFQTQTTTPPITEPAKPTTPPQTTPPPPDLPPVISSSPKKKFGSGRIIATILGILVLIGGVGAGILLTQQKQLIPQKAAAIDVTCSSGGSFTTSGGHKYCVVDKHLDHYSQAAAQCAPYGTFASLLDGETKTDITDAIASIKTEASNLATINPGCSVDDSCTLVFADSCQQFTDKYGKSDPAFYTDNVKGTVSSNIDCSMSAMGFAITPPGRAGFINDGGGGTYHCTNGNGEICTGGRYDGDSSVGGVVCELPNTVGPSAQCISVKAYSGNSETPLTDAELAALKTGNEVNFCVLGSSTVAGGGAGPAFPGSFDQAQFSINGNVKTAIDLTHLTATTRGICQPYTILATDTAVNVKAKIHHTSGWVGETF